MKISNIELIPVKAQQGLICFANCVIDDSLYLGNIAIFTRADGSGYRCVYPTKKLSNGSDIPIFHPIKSQLGKVIEKSISKSVYELFKQTKS
jgi:DNA-binding cell septation regulator SpoVG